LFILMELMHHHCLNFLFISQVYKTLNSKVRHDIAEILLKVALCTKNQSINQTPRKDIIPRLRITYLKNVYIYI
jgi:hypothetical protein